MAKKRSIDLDQFFHRKNEEDDLNYLLGAAPEETVQKAAERGLPVLHLATESVAPDPQQLRHLPHPQELRRRAAAGDRSAELTLEGLHELGRSIVEHGQLQPIIVYPDSDSHNPAVTHRILNGQRRWSAAVLAEQPTIWAVEIQKPSDVNRLLHQFEENERREDFCDIERAWALVQLKEALQAEAHSDVPWGVVEERLQLSTQRRQDLLRLLRFSDEGQTLILRHGWSEWMLRSLHMALSAGKLNQDEANDILRALGEAQTVNAAIVAEIVEGYQKQVAQKTTDSEEAASTSARAAAIASNGADVTRKLTRLRRNVEQLRSQVAAVKDQRVRETWKAEAERLRRALDSLLSEI